MAIGSAFRGDRGGLPDRLPRHAGTHLQFRTPGNGQLRRRREGVHLRLSETPIVPGAADFCLLSARAHAALAAMPERHRFLRGMISWIGFDRAYAPYTAPPRAAGRSQYTTLKMVGLALDALLSFSAR
jgi:hypothetical protein